MHCADERSKPRAGLEPAEPKPTGAAWSKPASRPASESWPPARCCAWIPLAAAPHWQLGLTVGLRAAHAHWPPGQQSHRLAGSIRLSRVSCSAQRRNRAMLISGRRQGNSIKAAPLGLVVGFAFAFAFLFPFAVAVAVAGRIQAAGRLNWRLLAHEKVCKCEFGGWRRAVVALLSSFCSKLAKPGMAKERRGEERRGGTNAGSSAPSGPVSGAQTGGLQAHRLPRLPKANHRCPPPPSARPPLGAAAAAAAAKKHDSRPHQLELYGHPFVMIMKRHSASPGARSMID